MKKKAIAVCMIVMITIGLTGCRIAPSIESSTLTAITNVKIFDGVNSINESVVVIEGPNILSVGGEIPQGATIIDGNGATLMPGLIDSHVHTDMNGLSDALKFGVTTVLELQGTWSKRERERIAENDRIADVRSAGMGISPEGGHPSQYMASHNFIMRFIFRFPFVNTVDEAIKHVDRQVSSGADYIKIFIEDGTIVGAPELSVTSLEVARAATERAHSHGKMAIAHVTTVEGTRIALNAGVDGLAHLFFDQPHTAELISEIKNSGVFVIPTLVTGSSAFGNDAYELAADPRVSSRLDNKWLDALSRSINSYPEGNFEDSLASVKALHVAGVDILAGSDVADPLPVLGGLAHGASLHHELRLLVVAGLEPIEAIRSATSIPAYRFGHTDRGKIAPGARADLLLVDGDPLTNIDDTLNILAVWRRGVALP